MLDQGGKRLGTHCAVWVYVWSLQCYSDAVEKYEDQHHMIKHFMGNDLLAHHSEPADTGGAKYASDSWVSKRLPPEWHILKRFQQVCHQHQSR